MIRGTRIVVPLAALLAIPDAPPGYFAHWARPAPVPQAGFGAAAPSYPIKKTKFQSRAQRALRLKRLPSAHSLLSAAKRGRGLGTGPQAGLGGSPAFPFFKTSEFQSRAQRALRLKRLPSAHSLQSPAKRRWGLRGSPIVSPSRQTCVSGPGASFCFAEIPVRSRFAPGPLFLLWGKRWAAAQTRQGTSPLDPMRASRRYMGVCLAIAGFLR